MFLTYLYSNKFDKKRGKLVSPRYYYIQRSFNCIIKRWYIIFPTYFKAHNVWLDTEFIPIPRSLLWGSHFHLKNKILIPLNNLTLSAQQVKELTTHQDVKIYSKFSKFILLFQEASIFSPGEFTSKHAPCLNGISKLPPFGEGKMSLKKGSPEKCVQTETQLWIIMFLKVRLSLDGSAVVVFFLQGGRGEWSVIPDWRKTGVSCSHQSRKGLPFWVCTGKEWTSVALSGFPGILKFSFEC